jgi:hypothetical protein
MPLCWCWCWCWVLLQVLLVLMGQVLTSSTPYVLQPACPSMPYLFCCYLNAQGLELGHILLPGLAAVVCDKQKSLASCPESVQSFYCIWYQVMAPPQYSVLIKHQRVELL